LAPPFYFSKPPPQNIWLHLFKRWINKIDIN